MGGAFVYVFENLRNQLQHCSVLV